MNMVPPEDALLMAATYRVAPEHTCPIIQLLRNVHGAHSSLHTVINILESPSPDSREIPLKSGAPPPEWFRTR
jgi:hypothetical protein